MVIIGNKTQMGYFRKFQYSIENDGDALRVPLRKERKASPNDDEDSVRLVHHRSLTLFET